VIFIIFGKGGDFAGEAPNVSTLWIILKEPSFWIMMGLFSLGIGASFGVYTMLPLYLVAEKGMDRTWANTFVAFSRIFTLGSSILVGWITDRVGPRKTLMGVFMAIGIITLLLFSWGLSLEPGLFSLSFFSQSLPLPFFQPGLQRSLGLVLGGLRMWLSLSPFLLVFFSEAESLPLD
jgi:NNP family nitrate/nitrite transporter-like MFS transporter